MSKVRWDNGRATADGFGLHVYEQHGGWMWEVLYECGESEEVRVASSHDEDGHAAPCRSEEAANDAAESALRWLCVNPLRTLGLHSDQLALLGAREASHPRIVGRLTPYQLGAALRTVMEAVGPIELTGRAVSVRVHQAQVFFDLRGEDGEGVVRCRVAPTLARALSLTPLEGGRYTVKGIPTVYVRRGEMQLDVCGLGEAQT